MPSLPRFYVSFHGFDFFPSQSCGWPLELYEPENAVIRFGFVRAHSGSSVERTTFWTERLVKINLMNENTGMKS